MLTRDTSAPASVTGSVCASAVTASVAMLAGTNLTHEETNDSAALNTSFRKLHDYSRVDNFAVIVDKFDESSAKRGANVDSRVGLKNVETASTCSLQSIPSIEWDTKARSDYDSRSRSLPRQKTSNAGRLFRTRSHSSFVNAYVRNPEPVHFHLPRSGSYGTSGSSSWEFKDGKSSGFTTSCVSVHNLSQKSKDEHGGLDVVKVKQSLVPVFKFPNVDDEFIESQEFDEDNYIEDAASSLSSDNKTVVERIAADRVQGGKKVAHNLDIKVIAEEEGVNATYRAECAQVIESSNGADDDVTESTEGEYYSFNDENDFEEAAYNSPIKDLCDKDIRDYTVPIDCYCDDYGIKDTYKKSPQKNQELMKRNTLEPILEESKSSFGDENNSSNNESSKTVLHSENTTLIKELQTGEIKQEENKVIVTANESKLKSNETPLSNATSCLDNCLKYFPLLDYSVDCNKRKSSINSSASAGEPLSFNSTTEFENLEIVAELIVSMIDKVVSYFQNDLVVFDNNNRIESQIPDKCVVSDTKEDITTVMLDSGGDDNNDCNESGFSITKIIHDIEKNVTFFSSVVTNESINDTDQRNKLIEGLINYIFDTVFFNLKDRVKSKKTKRKVITVVDNEDILFTAKSLWTSQYERSDLYPNSVNNTQINTSDVNLECLQKDFNLSSSLYDVNKNRLTMSESEKIDTNLENIQFKSSCENSNYINVEKAHPNNIKDFVEQTQDPSYLLTNDSNSSVSFNTAFFEEKLNRQDLELNKSSLEIENDRVFKACGESPINRANDGFIADDLSVLFEKEEDILGSPFVKKAPLISMSQTEHSGGIKYWLSFDESLADTKWTPRKRSLRIFEDNKIPSFFKVDFDSTTDDLALRDSNRNTHEYGAHDAYPSCSNAIDYDSDNYSLTYNSHLHNHRRYCSSWPPFESSLFYKLISKFRMTESFEISDLRELDDSL